jgi:hypothetical protein
MLLGGGSSDMTCIGWSGLHTDKMQAINASRHLVVEEEAAWGCSQ